ncbi:MAG: heavy metal translocating P-type ATPase [Proteobacteria bacterium]|nr:heavy metal translocating P-type ATPase [Pseudomonadota bacterium]MCL2307117.1 heavy metal translocating P-type ATPase [Pseudomonadota bacterium]
MSKPVEPSLSPAAEARFCYHCGTENPQGVRWQAVLKGEPRTFCCAGCQAVAQTIHAAGLDAFYATRTVLAQAPEETQDEWVAYDDERVVRDFVRKRGVGPDGKEEHEIALLLEGLTCGACVWLIESWLMKQPGVVEARVNFASRRATVVWHPETAPLSQLLRAVARIGYRAYPYDPARRDIQARRERRTMLFRMGVALFGMMQVMMMAVPHYISNEVPADTTVLLRWASLVLTLPVLFYSAQPFFKGAWRDLSMGRAGMDVPVALGLSVAFAASLWATFRGTGAVYYESVTMFVALLLVARYFEAMVRQRSGDAIEAMARQQPVLADRLTEWPRLQTTQPVPATTLLADDYVLVRPGAVVPADGVVVEGNSHVEEAVLTGESWPVRRVPGDSVFAGAVNRENVLIVQVQAVGEGTRLATILRLVDRAASERPRVAQIADRVASWFIAALLALAVVVGVVWWLIDPSRAVEVVFALLVITCPCALSLATPTALSAAAGALGRRRVVLARSDAQEALARVTTLVFDKTGTLTEGKVTLNGMCAVAGSGGAELLSIAQALEAPSEHPLARAFRSEGKITAETVLPAVSDLTIVSGNGIEGTVAGTRWRIGRFDFVAALSGADATPVLLPESLARFIEQRSFDETMVFLGNGNGNGTGNGAGNGIQAVFALGDALRPQAREVVAALHAMGIQTVLLSGDRHENAEALAKTLGIETAHGGLFPEDKRRYILERQAAGEVVAMVGDGVNDAPGLAQAQVSISLGSATSLAQWTADVVILSDELPRLTDALRHSRRALRVVRQNLSWAVGYNLIAVPAAALGLVTPLIAALGMSLSSLTVVLNALRISGIRGQESAVRD